MKSRFEPLLHVWGIAECGSWQMALMRTVKAIVKIKKKKKKVRATDTFERKITSEASYGEMPAVKLQLRAKEAPAVPTVN